MLAADALTHSLPWYFSAAFIVVWAAVLVGVLAIVRWRRKMHRLGPHAGRSSSRLKGLPPGDPSSSPVSRRTRQ